MYKNQLQELAQRSCFNLPSYTCIREGPDHAPRFKAVVNFNGETFESPHFFSTLRQAEHAAAEVALGSLSNRGPSHSLAARILDETGVYKNLLQEIAQRVGAPLPQYTTCRSGLGHLPVFTGTVELAGIIFTGEPAKNKKQAEKNAAMAAWTSLKQLAQQDASSSSETDSDELEQIRVARALLNYRLKEKMAMSNSSASPLPFRMKFPIQNPRPSSPQRPLATTSKILPLLFRRKPPPQNRPPSSAANESLIAPSQQPPAPLQPTPLPTVPESRATRPLRFPAAGATPYVPIYKGIAPPVTIRTAVPVFSAPPRPPPSIRPPQAMHPQAVQIAPPVCIRQAVPVFAAAPARKEAPPTARTLLNEPSGKLEEDIVSKSGNDQQETVSKSGNDQQETVSKSGNDQPEIVSKSGNDQQETVRKSGNDQQEIVSKSGNDQQETVSKSGNDQQEIEAAKSLQSLQI